MVRWRLQKIKILRIFLMVWHPREAKWEDHCFLTTFRGLNAPKSGPFKYKNNVQTLPKKLLHNFEIVEKSTFWTPKMVVNDPSNRPKWAKFWPIISIFEVISRPLKLTIHPNVGPLRSKTKPKYLLNKSKKTLKKSRNRLFGHQKMVKNDP